MYGTRARMLRRAAIEAVERTGVDPVVWRRVYRHLKRYWNKHRRLPVEMKMKI